jgi:hypothetical protein
MYFEASITIDPSQVTKIEKVKPTKAFKRMLYHLTKGGIAEKEERETFTAVSILQQLNKAFIQKGVTNVIRLAHDDIDFYLDEQGLEDDLKDAFDAYELKIDHSMSTYFNQLILVLEHEDGSFKYLLETKISKNHKVGDYPIEIKLTGLLKGVGKSSDRVKKQMSEIFSSQKNYDNYKLEKLHDFTTFIDDFVLCIQKMINVDDVKSDIKTKIVVPKEKITSQKGIKNNRTSNYYGVHYGYYGFDDYLLYSMMWSSVGQDYDLSHTDIYYESEEGSELGHLDEVESASSHFDDSTDFDNRSDLFADSEDTSSDKTSSEGSWFDSDSSGDYDSSDSSSCSSCSSCGGD